MALPHWILRLAFAALASWLLFVAWAQQELRAGTPAARGGSEAKRVLVVHAPGAEGDAAFAANLAGRFGSAALRRFDRYRPGELARFDAALVLAAADAPPPEPLLRDARGARRPLVWIGPAAPLFADPAFAAAQPWRPGAPAEEALAVRYRGRDFPRDLRAPPPPAGAIVLDPARTRILADSTGRDGAARPWAIRSGDLFHLVETPFAFAHEDGPSLVFADLLFEALAPETPERHLALVRLDGIGPAANPRRIRALADLLAEEGVPFAIAVADDAVGRLQDGRAVRIGLEERPQVVRALDHARDRGGSLVAAVADASAAARRSWHRARLGRPRLAVAVPPGAPRAAYAARYGRLAVGDRLQFFPYPAVERGGDFVLPENLGLPGTDGADRLIATAARNLAVRDGFASFAFPWDGDPEQLRSIVRAIRGLGYRFVGPEEAIRAAPSHAVRAVHRASPVAVAASSWVRALPPLGVAALVALLASVAAVGLAGEALLRRLDRPAQRAA